MLIDLKGRLEPNDRKTFQFSIIVYRLDSGILLCVAWQSTESNTLSN